MVQEYVVRWVACLRAIAVIKLLILNSECHGRGHVRSPAAGSTEFLHGKYYKLLEEASNTKLILL